MECNSTSTSEERKSYRARKNTLISISMHMNSGKKSSIEEVRTIRDYQESEANEETSEKTLYFLQKCVKYDAYIAEVARETRRKR